MQIDLLNNSRFPTREEALSPIAWYEGLQLLPQHFQLLDTRLDSLLRRQMLAACPYSWGVDRLELDATALASGVLRVLAVAGQFQDGLVFAWDAKQGGVLEHTLPADMPEGPVRYALSVPVDGFRDAGAKVGRYRQAVSAPVADLTNPDEKVAITRWLPNLSIRAFDPLSAHYLQIPFVEVVKTATGFELTGFHPSAVRLLAGSACMKQITAMVQLLRSKAKQVQAPALPTPVPADHKTTLNWVSGSLIGGLLRLEAQLMSGVAHPYDVFLDLCSVAGQVAAFTGRVPECFPTYDHANLALPILAASNFIVDAVNGVGADHRLLHEVPFVHIDGAWVGVVPTQVERGTDVLLRVRFGGRQTDSAVLAWLEHTLICFDVDENRCREMRVRGFARREHLSVAELNLLATPDQRYVQVSLPPDVDAAGKRLLFRGPGARATVTVDAVSFVMAKTN